LFQPGSPGGRAIQVALAWLDRAASNFIAMGMLALSAQTTATAPILKTVVANAERLGR
jgi:hypothetical protein